MRRVPLAATLLMTLLTLASCGSDDPQDPGPTPAAERIELSFEGDGAPPTERVQVETGEEIELVVKSDEPGELHVHTKPGKVLKYAAGTTTLKLTIDEPGVVDVERHEPEALVLQLEVG